MQLTIDEIREIAHLARLDLNEEEEATFAAQVSRILDYVERIGAVDTSHATPIDGAPVEARDEPSAGLRTEEFLANAPEALDHFLLVPKVKKSDG